MSGDIHALSGAYAVDALDDLERALFERHLAECGVCRDEVESMRETATLVSEVSLQAPPASLRTSVLAGIQTIRPIPPVVAATEARLTGGAAHRRRFPALVAAAVALIAFGGLGASVWHPWQQQTQTSAVAAIMAAPDAQTFHGSLTDGATASVIRSQTKDAAVFTAAGLPALPDGKVYELWLQHDRGFEPAGLLTDPNQPVVLQGDPSDAVVAGITIENAGGSTTPSAPILGTVPFKA